MMLVCIDRNGDRIIPGSYNVSADLIRSYSKSGNLLCPDCHGRLQYVHGSQKRPYFRHTTNECSYLYHEPETEEHRQGKWALYQWLAGCYPQAIVELEYRIEETNQRSDVIVIHPDGSRWAFEYQCYTGIGGQGWLERHKLYQEANVIDFWILGGSVHKYGKTGGEVDKTKHYLCDLEKALLYYQLHLDYVFVEENSFLTLRRTRYWKRLIEQELKKANDSDLQTADYTSAPQAQEPWSESIGRIFDWNYKAFQSSLEHIHFRGTELTNKDLDDEYEQQKIELRRHESETEKRRKQQEERQRERERGKKRLRVTSKKCLSERRSLDAFVAGMTPSERKLFTRLCEKHAFIPENFPGLLHLNLEEGDVIRTPPQLWQLWIYDRYISGKLLKYPKVWLPRIKNDMWDMKVRGVFRLSYREDAHFSFAIYRFFDALDSLNITERISFKNGNYHRILIDKLPTFETAHPNVTLKFALEASLAGDMYGILCDIGVIVKDYITLLPPRF